MHPYWSFWGIVVLAVIAGGPAAADGVFEWNEGTRRFFRSGAAQEIVLDVASPTDHRWIAFQMQRLRYLEPSRSAADDAAPHCATLFGAGAWLAGLQWADTGEVDASFTALCVPAPTALAADVAWQHRVCAEGFHKYWQGRIADTRFSCRGQMSAAEIARLAPDPDVPAEALPPGRQRLW